MTNTKQEIMIKEEANFIKPIDLHSFDIKNMIYVVRNQQVMIDSDLAMLYQVETKVFNQAVKRNIKRFPENFRFQLSKDEYASLRSQVVTLNENTSNALLFERISNIELKQLEYQKKTDGKLEQIFAYISEHEESQQKVFFDGQIYDSFSLIVSLIQKADKEIILIDGYVDVNTLNLLSKKKMDVAVTIYTQKQTKLTKVDVQNFNAQYPIVHVKYSKVFHDRFLIFDRNIAYHIGASLKDAGKKCFGINLIQDSGIIKDILQRLELETE